MILKDLATFHAVPLALKLEDPQLFDEQIKKHLIRPVFKFPEPKEGKEPPSLSFNAWLEALESFPNCTPHLPNLKKIVDEIMQNPASIFGRREKRREPFATISHNDLWVNNTMQVFQGTKMLKNKFVDFQVYSYDSPAHDLLFSIWSSVRGSVIKEHFDDLVDYYYKNFQEVLAQLGCDVAPFGPDEFEEELKIASKFEILHTFMMTRPIFAEKGQFAFDMSKGPVAVTKEELTDVVLDRCQLVTEICGRRGWI